MLHCKADGEGKLFPSPLRRRQRSASLSAFRERPIAKAGDRRGKLYPPDVGHFTERAFSDFGERAADSHRIKHAPRSA